MKYTEGNTSDHSVYHARIDGSGRIVLPAELREALGVATGDTVIVSRDQDGVHLRTQQEAIRRAQDYFCNLIPPSVELVDELIAERKAEAARE